MKKLKRNTFYYFILIVLALLLIIKGFDGSPLKEGHEQPFKNKTHLILTEHAKCRMACRQISEKEIKEILQKGTINYKKSGIGPKGDSTFAVEGYSIEKQHIRVVVAPENDGMIIITCIDLDREWPCDCD
ncbi:MAG: DUF4258 domain-containing protein [Ginsengibacter sp.]